MTGGGAGVSWMYSFVEAEFKNFVTVLHFQTYSWEMHSNSRQPAAALEITNMNVMEVIINYRTFSVVTVY